MNRRLSVVITAGLLAGAAWLAGCGQKGALTMPSPLTPLTPPAALAPTALPASSPPPSK